VVTGLLRSNLQKSTIEEAETYLRHLEEARTPALQETYAAVIRAIFRMRKQLGSRGLSDHIQIDKLAKDLCIFCGIEEAKVQWRQAGLARLKEDRKGKGKAVERLDIPEKLEGRRRLAVALRLSPQADLALFYPQDVNEEGQDLHSALERAQRELFEEEIFAEVTSPPIRYDAHLLNTSNSF